MKFEKKRLMIVDDDPSFLDLMQDYFVSHQYGVACVDDAVKALSTMREKGFKVVVLDYSMPEVMGNELIAMLQHINPQARFIIVTGLRSEEVEQKFKGLGYFACFE